MNVNNQATRVAIILVVFVLGIAAIAVFSGNKKADSNKDNTSSKIQKKSTSKKSESTTVKKTSYTYVAQPGDSYTLFARKAVQSYTRATGQKLSHAQIIYAETVLTQAAGSPVLNVGQKESFVESSLKSIIAKAGKLTDSQKALWDVYAQQANFDTSHVG